MFLQTLTRLSWVGEIARSRFSDLRAIDESLKIVIEMFSFDSPKAAFSVFLRRSTADMREKSNNSRKSKEINGIMY